MKQIKLCLTLVFLVSVFAFNTPESPENRSEICEECDFKSDFARSKWNLKGTKITVDGCAAEINEACIFRLGKQKYKIKSLKKGKMVTNIVSGSRTMDKDFIFEKSENCK